MFFIKNPSNVIGYILKLLATSPNKLCVEKELHFFLNATKSNFHLMGLL
jgi:hypothetical protein